MTSSARYEVVADRDPLRGRTGARVDPPANDEARAVEAIVAPAPGRPIWLEMRDVARNAGPVVLCFAAGELGLRDRSDPP